MILSWLIVALSMAMVFFYFQATCQRILRRQFDQEYFRSIANVIRLEFPSLQEALEDSGASLDYSRLPKALKCDFLALTHLLRNTADAKPGFSKEQRVLMLYFHVQFLSLAARRFLRVGERKAALRLTSILQYLDNVVGERMNEVEFGNSTTAGYLVNPLIYPPRAELRLDLPLRNSKL
jgi:hypothetical protein